MSLFLFVPGFVEQIFAYLGLTIAALVLSFTVIILFSVVFFAFTWKQRWMNAWYKRLIALLIIIAISVVGIAIIGGGYAVCWFVVVIFFPPICIGFGSLYLLVVLILCVIAVILLIVRCCKGGAGDSETPAPAPATSVQPPNVVTTTTYQDPGAPPMYDGQGPTGPQYYYQQPMHQQPVVTVEKFEMKQ